MTSAKLMLRGKLLTPHMDYKANVDARIKSELPDLAAITMYLYFGYYPQNLAFLPLCSPIAYVCTLSIIHFERRNPLNCSKPGTDQYIQTLPTRGDAKVLLAGDMTVNPGLWVRQVLATDDKAHGKYSNVALEKWTF
jgi:hypothetical protein